jgi:excisionase family DNA binding protein
VCLEPGGGVKLKGFHLRRFGVQALAVTEDSVRSRGYNWVLIGAPAMLITPPGRHEKKGVFPCRYSVAASRLWPDERRCTASPKRSCRSHNRAGSYGSSPLAPVRLCADSLGRLLSHEEYSKGDTVSDPTTTAYSDRLLTPAEAALLARCSLRTLRRAYTSGNLAAYRSPGGRSVRLLREEVVAFFLAETVGPRPARSRPRRRRTTRLTARLPGVNGDPLSIEAIRARRAR